MTGLIDNNVRFILFQCCIPVKGRTRSLICDIQRGDIYFIPNALCTILKEHKGKTLKEIKNHYPIRNHSDIEEYFKFLFENELLLKMDEDEKELFPDISLEWKSPHVLSNTIIDLNEESLTKRIELKNAINQMSSLKCQAVQLRFFCELGDIQLKTFLNFFNETNIKVLNLVLKFKEGYHEKYFKELIDSFERIENVFIYFSNRDTNINYGEKSISYVKRTVNSELCCGQILQSYFSSNIKLFTESQHHNTCLNRKIAIDVDGNIKNCPSMPQSYGNIKDTTLQEALDHPDFKQHWNITKDKIHVCKDCEFRHICTDCRAYIEDPEDIYSKPLKCGYNPYTGEWSEWSTNPLKQKAMEYYGMEEM